MNSQEILEQINSEISRLQQVKALLQGSSVSSVRTKRRAGRPARTTALAPAVAAATPPVKVKRVLSLEARRKIAAAQRRRWANTKRLKAQGK